MFSNDSILDSPKYNPHAGGRSSACQEGEIVRLKAENKRLRFALKEIAESKSDMNGLALGQRLSGIAKRALEAKP